MTTEIAMSREIVSKRTSLVMKGSAVRVRASASSTGARSKRASLSFLDGRGAHSLPAMFPLRRIAFALLCALAIGVPAAEAFTIALPGPRAGDVRRPRRREQVLQRHATDAARPSRFAPPLRLS